MQPKKIALLAREAAEDKKAEDIIVIDVAKVSSIAHYFLIMHGNSDRQVKAIAQNMMDTLKSKKVQTWHVEGLDNGQWVLIDFGPVIAHIFLKDVRDFYNLERLWGDAPRI